MKVLPQIFLVLLLFLALGCTEETTDSGDLPLDENLEDNEPMTEPGSILTENDLTGNEGGDNPDPGNEGGDNPDPGNEGGDNPDPGNEGGDNPDPGNEGGDNPDPGNEGGDNPDPGNEGGDNPDPGNEGGDNPDPGNEGGDNPDPGNEGGDNPDPGNEGGDNPDPGNEGGDNPDPGNEGGDNPDPGNEGGDNPDPGNEGGDNPDPVDEGGDNPDPVDEGGDNPEPPQSALEIADLCKDGNKETLLLTLNFPAQSPDCPWGQGDNLGKNQGLVSARISKIIHNALPPNTVLCSASFGFEGGAVQPDTVGPSCEGECCEGQASQGQCQPENADCYCDQACVEFDDCCPDWNQFCGENNEGGGWGGEGNNGNLAAFVYDDHVFFTINDVLIAASHAETVDGLYQEDGLLYYDWNDVKGQAFNSDDANAYCLDACAIPDASQYGGFSFSLGTANTHKLSLIAFEEDRFDFSLIVSGDNDEDSDCSHGPLSITVEIQVTNL